MISKNCHIILILLWINFFQLLVSQNEHLEDDCENELPADCGNPKVKPSLLSRLRIVGGNYAVPNSWPWQLSLQQSSFGNTWKHNCGASILSKCYAITAAHCVSDHEAATLRLIAGLQDRVKDAGSIHKVARIIIHPHYKGVDTQWVGDIALLKVSAPFKFSRNVSAICLPDSEPVDGDTGAATGWGYSQNAGHLNSTLNQVEVPLISKCELHYANIPFEGRFCAGYPKTGGKDTCQGDSGGPLITRPAGTAFYLSGVTSVGAGCAERLKPGIYTNVFQFRDWINGYIKDCKRDYARQCEQVCELTRDSFRCICRDGFSLNPDLKSCSPASSRMQIGFQECGITDSKEEPWLLSLRNAHKLDVNICIGLLIKPNWIITTTLCVSRITDRRQPRVVRLFSNSVNLEDILISKIICNSADGVCLLETGENLALTPICLPTSAFKKEDDCAVGGWMQDSTPVVVQKCAQKPRLLCSFVDKMTAPQNVDESADTLTCTADGVQKKLYGIMRSPSPDKSKFVEYIDVYRNLEWIRKSIGRK